MLGFVGPQDMFLVVIVLILLFGAKKLPELARGMGKSLGEFKKAREEYEQESTHAATPGEAETKAKDPVAK